MAEAKKKRTRRNVGRAIAHVKASFNNTIITVTDTTGQVLAWDSAGTIGYKGSRKSTPFAAQRAAQKVADKIRKMGVYELEVQVKGPGSGRGDPFPGRKRNRDQEHRGPHSAAAQRLSAAQASSCLRTADA
jgi:small subunit ribosomal protein S11